MNDSRPVLGLPCSVTEFAAIAIVCRPCVATGLVLKVNVAVSSLLLRVTAVAGMPFTVSAPACRLAGLTALEKVIE